MAGSPELDLFLSVRSSVLTRLEEFDGRFRAALKEPFVKPLFGDFSVLVRLFFLMASMATVAYKDSDSCICWVLAR